MGGLVQKKDGTSICLLIFTINNEADAHEIFKQVEGYVDEAVIVDSSSDKHLNRLKDLFRSDPVKIYHTIPLGYPDPLRTFALKKIKSEWILYIDTDERPSEALLEKTRNLGPVDAYYVPRKEIRGYYTYHIRLFRRKKVKFTGMIHETAKVKGIVSTLDSKQLLFHLSGENLHKDRRYATIEVYTRLLAEVRPSMLLVLMRKLIEGSWSRRWTRFMMNSFIYLHLLIKKAFLTVVAIDEEKKDMKDYINLIRSEFSRLDDKSRFIALASSIDIARNRDLTSYLNLDNEAYVQSLPMLWIFNENGLYNLLRLIRSRVEENDFFEIL